MGFVDVKAAFDSVDRKAVWKLLQRRGLHSNVEDHAETLYNDVCSCVNVVGDFVMSDWFTIRRGVRQGCRIAPDLFMYPKNSMLERTVRASIPSQKHRLRSFRKIAISAACDGTQRYDVPRHLFVRRKLQLRMRFTKYEFLLVFSGNSTNYRFRNFIPAFVEDHKQCS